MELDLRRWFGNLTIMSQKIIQGTKQNKSQTQLKELDRSTFMASFIKQF